MYAKSGARISETPHISPKQASAILAPSKYDNLSQRRRNNFYDVAITLQMMV